jgi:hypothetical protein
VLPQGVCHVVFDVVELTRYRQNLTQQRVVWITDPHPGHIATGHTHPKRRGGSLSGLQETRIEAERGDQVVRARNRVSHFRLPARRLAGVARTGGFSVVLAGGG